MMGCKAQNGQLTLVKDGKSDYNIVIPNKPSRNEEKAANVLASYIQQISGYKPVIERENGFRGAAGIYVGDTYRGGKFYSKRIAPEGFLVATDQNNVYLRAGGGKGIVYAAYNLVEKYWGCRKWDAGKAHIPRSAQINIPAGLTDLQEPVFTYRQVYYPAESDPEFLEWHRLHRLDDLFGLWGHSMHKIVPPQQYFKTHPEYFATVNGRPTPAQLNYSNEEVFRITVAYLKKATADNPDAVYWSLSIGDDVVYDQGAEAQKIMAEEQSPAGPVWRFVNRVAAQFPDQQFVTLAYLWAAKPPVKTSGRDNVIPMLSNIDAFRDRPLREAPSAAAFRRNLEGWKKISKQVFLWDYTTQFTNYLAPFPDLHTLGPNADFYREAGITGIFAQGSGETISDLSDLKTYVQAKLLWQPSANAETLTKEFINGFYGEAAPAVEEYINTVQNLRSLSKRPLDIYGNPVQEVNAWLSPANLDQLSALLDKAESSVESKPDLLGRVQKLRLGLEYTVLQQSRYFGIEKFGFRQWNADKENFEVKPNWQKRVDRFADLATKSGVKEISEGGANPAAYAGEWQTVIAEPYRVNRAVGKSIRFVQPFTEEWKGKGAATAIDGNRGYIDFSYNWLLFYGVPVEAVVDMGQETAIKSIETNFLDDPRHWIFAPANATISVSPDGTNWKEVAAYQNKNLEEEHYEVSRQQLLLTTTVKARFIKVIANPPAQLPAYRFRENRKPTTAIDEIWVY